MKSLRHIKDIIDLGRSGTSHRKGDQNYFEKSDIVEIWQLFDTELIESDQKPPIALKKLHNTNIEHNQRNNFTKFRTFEVLEIFETLLKSAEELLTEQ